MTSNLASAATAPRLPLDRAGRRTPTGWIVVGALCLHLLAATVVYRDLVTDLYALLAASPQLSVLATGLTRLLATSVFLPPVVPTLLLVLAALRLRTASAHHPAIARWLAWGWVAIAADGMLRALGVLVAPAPSNVGELLDLPSRMSPGARMIADLAGLRPGPGLTYWLVITSAAAVVAVWMVARALHAGEVAALEPAARRRRRRGGDVVALQMACVAVGGFLLLGIIGKATLPTATRLFLELFG